MKHSEYSLQRPEEFLSAKALERRARQGIAVDSTDLPVCRTYINKVKELGARVVVTGKWENFITVSCNDTTVMDAVAALPFVRSVEQVWKVSASALTPKADKRDSLVNQPAIHPDSIYGTAITQIAMSHGDELHKAGFRGEGMTIAVIDAGYHNVDRITAMRNIRIRGTPTGCCAARTSGASNPWSRTIGPPRWSLPTAWAWTCSTRLWAIMSTMTRHRTSACATWTDSTN